MDDEGFFKLSHILSFYDNDLKEEYQSNLYQFASIVIKADGVVTLKEETVLKRIMKSTEKNKKKEEQPIKVETPNQEQSLQEVLEELNSLIGLNEVKEEIKTLTNFVRIQKTREASGLKASNVSYHIIFTGNPGTGKTTVARIVAKIYNCLGVLSRAQLVETDRSGLIAEYLGQT
ncbi:MAG: AAA family ATPase, partial [Flavisolibacter sp.]|nr:AAA family ATPase [Flavisolibacter sp.]